MSPGCDSRPSSHAYFVQDYFGSDANGTLTTIVDTDIYGAAAGYCKAVRAMPLVACGNAYSSKGRCCSRMQSNAKVPCKFIHHSGLDSLCISPGNPDTEACHRYHVVTYDKCAALENGSSAHLAGNVDVGNVFNSNGVLKGCEGNVLSITVVGYVGDASKSPPADHQLRCTIPWL